MTNFTKRSIIASVAFCLYEVIVCVIGYFIGKGIGAWVNEAE